MGTGSWPLAQGASSPFCQWLLLAHKVCPLLWLPRKKLQDILCCLNPNFSVSHWVPLPWVVLLLSLLVLFSCSADFVIPVGYDMPGFPVIHYLLEGAQTHVHWVGSNGHDFILWNFYSLEYDYSKSLKIWAEFEQWMKCFTFHLNQILYLSEWDT